MNDTRLLTPEAAAERLGISTTTLLRWLRAGHIAGYRCGRKTIRVSWPEVLIALRTSTPEREPSDQKDPT
jgi:excisionase family DNA binding protein